MKRQLLSLIFVGATLVSMAQSFTVSGPRTIFELNTINKGNKKYTFFNFDKAREIASSDSATANWDIAFCGTTIILNGGISGPSEVTGQVLKTTSYLDQVEAPTTNYAADALTSKAIKTGAGNGWYNYYASPDYQSSPHSIKPIADRVIAIKLADGRYVKLEILNYYQGVPNDVPSDVTAPEYTGVGGYYSFRYQVADQGSTDWNQKITRVTNLYADLAGGTIYNYFNLASADTILTSESTTALWDLGFKTQTIIVNGSGAAESQVLAESFDEVTTASEDGWNTSDLTSWSSYNDETHIVSIVPHTTILTKNSYGRFSKLEVESYYNTITSKSRFISFSYYFQPYNSSDLKTAETTTSINKVEAGSGFSMYPNPISSAKQNINFKLEDSNKTAVAIYDMQGVKVYSFVLVNNEVNGLSLNQGIYMVTLETNGKISQQRLVVQ